MRLISMAAGLAAAVSAGPAFGAPVIFGSHYEDFAQDSCTASCQVYFGAIPSGKLLIITNVACSMISPGPIIGMNIAALSGPASGVMRLAALQAGPSTLVDQAYYTSINQPTNFSLGGGRYPRVAFGVLTSGYSSLTCQISGVLFPNPGPGPTPAELN